jgi:emp24/gp25L/p24 family/GOLD
MHTQQTCNTSDQQPSLLSLLHSYFTDITLDSQSPDYSPVYLTINLVPSGRVYDTDLHNAPVRQHLKPTSVLIEKVEGSVTHKLEMDGTVNLCWRAGMATKEKPLRFAFIMHWTEAEPSAPVQVDYHLSQMEVELKRVQNGMRSILRQADYSKEQESLFHKNTLRMHAAATFWPVVQVCVLIITGFTQASHIVRFFKSRRII